MQHHEGYFQPKEWEDPNKIVGFKGMRLYDPKN